MRDLKSLLALFSAAALAGLPAFLPLTAGLPRSEAAAAQEAPEAVHRFGARRLEIGAFHGTLTLYPHDGPTIEARVGGPESRRRELTIGQRAGTLHIVDRPSAAGGRLQSVVAEGVSVIAQGGGRASVTIGGRNYSAGDLRPPLRLTLAVPRGLPLVLKGLAGEIEIGNLESEIALTLISGRARLGHVGPARLSLPGSGEIVAAGVEGALTVELAGSGDVVVRSGEVARLAVHLSGSGDVAFGGRAKRGDFILSGAGDIEVAELAMPPSARVTGSGEILLGNR
jgi:hypothetical protein